jgi:hypothetical protein
MDFLRNLLSTTHQPLGNALGHRHGPNCRCSGAKMISSFDFMREHGTAQPIIDAVLKHMNYDVLRVLDFAGSDRGKAIFEEYRRKTPATNNIQDSHYEAIDIINQVMLDMCGGVILTPTDKSRLVCLISMWNMDSRFARFCNQYYRDLGLDIYELVNISDKYNHDERIQSNIRFQLPIDALNRFIVMMNEQSIDSLSATTIASYMWDLKDEPAPRKKS